jgi:hypothetical protein
MDHPRGQGSSNSAGHQLNPVLGKGMKWKGHTFRRYSFAPDSFALKGFSVPIPIPTPAVFIRVDSCSFVVDGFRPEGLNHFRTFPRSHVRHLLPGIFYRSGGISKAAGGCRTPKPAGILRAASCDATRCPAVHRSTSVCGMAGSHDAFVVLVAFCEGVRRTGEGRSRE